MYKSQQEYRAIVAHMHRNNLPDELVAQILDMARIYYDKIRDQYAQKLPPRGDIYTENILRVQLRNLPPLERLYMYLGPGTGGKSNETASEMMAHYVRNRILYRLSS